MHVFLHKKKFSVLSALLLVPIFLFLTGCASKEVAETDVGPVEIEEAKHEETDPYEGFNRNVYVFNEVLDDYVAEPISDAYKWVTPQFVQTGVSNFFNNLKDINVVINDVLQGKMSQSADDGGRFLVNSTIGLLGLFDVATEMGLERHEEDFAQTLAVWGVPQGPYLVMPVLGPMTIRGIPGGVFDTATNPTSYIGLPFQLAQLLNARATAEGALNFIDEASLDSYVFTRESFLQYRKHLINDGQSNVNDDFLDLEEGFYEEDDELLDELDFKVTKTDKTLTSEPPLFEEAEKEQQADRVDSTLKSSLKEDSFEQASDSFDNAINLFNAVAHSFEEVDKKLERLKNK